MCTTTAAGGMLPYWKRGRISNSSLLPTTDQPGFGGYMKYRIFMVIIIVYSLFSRAKNP